MKNNTDERQDRVTIGARRDVKYRRREVQDVMTARVSMAHEKVMIATGPHLLFKDLAKLLNMTFLTYIIRYINT